METPAKTQKEFIKYCISGGMGAAIQVGATSLLVHRFSVYYLIAATIAYILSLCVSFLLQRYWTFADMNHTHKLHVMSVIYALISLVGLGLNTFLLYMFVEIMHISLLPAQIISIGIVALTSFALNRTLTFKEHTQ